ncbi:hypothetical protein [Aminipila terrae]|uniref:DUF4179 domain-containing protein n=1 Tax=Aminipila terrae TaxID=2697030 RepID=A0A6P1ML05_9FIRM|nr:hypothetical protein [Aminipila terrae]QHI71665.1 hypothetical protein Ami3637_04055 [Aminipila terrae]
MKDKELDLILRNALPTDFEPGYELNRKIIQKSREGNMNIKKVRRLSTAAVVCCLILCCSVSAFAAWKFLTPKDVAIEYGDKQLAKAFSSEDAVLMDKSKTYGDYTVTLLGSVSGGDLSDFGTDSSQSSQVSPDKTYAVVAISKTDGTLMPKTSEEEYGKEKFFISPLIQGLNPKDYNIVTMNGGYFDIVENGIMYRMIECDNIELFADRNLYLCVSNTTFYDKDAYNFNGKTGDISVNAKYKGMSLLFDLPLKADKADKKAADKYLKKLESAQSADSKNNSDMSDKKEKNKVDINQIISQWAFISEKKVTPDKDGRIYYSYETKNGSGDGYITEDALFKKDQTGYSKNFWMQEDNHGKIAVLYSKDKNGQITEFVYETNK